MSRSEPASISVSRRAASSCPEPTVVWLRGEYDIATNAALGPTLVGAADRDGNDLLVDLSGVTFMDASTVGAIIDSANRLRVRSHALEIRDPSPLARRVLEMCAPNLLMPRATTLVHAMGAPGARSRVGS